MAAQQQEDVIGDNYDVIIDGSILEGGGQIMRNSFALASLLHRSLKVFKVRANRPKPGLHAQHLTGIELVSQIHHGVLKGGYLHSPCIGYRPGRVALTAENCRITSNIGTAGSVCLLVQVALPCMIFIPFPTILTLIVSTFQEILAGLLTFINKKGGTNAIMAPTVDYMIEVFAPMASKMGVQMNIEIEKRGYFPKGGGIVHLHTTPLGPAGTALNPITLLDKGKIVSVRCKACVSRLPIQVAETECQTVRKMLSPKLGDGHVELFVEALDVTKESVGSGNWVQITATTSTGCIFGSSAISERGKTAEKVATEAVEHLLKDLSEGGCVDEFLQDQLLVFMSLANGVSRVRTGELSLHTKTSLVITEQLTGCKYTVEDLPSGPGHVITCEGINFKLKSQ